MSNKFILSIKFSQKFGFFNQISYILEALTAVNMLRKLNNNSSRRNYSTVLALIITIIPDKSIKNTSNTKYQ